MTKRNRTAQRWRQARRITQAVALLGAVILVVLTARDAAASVTANHLMRLDPLAALAAMLSSRRWLIRFVPAIALLAATLLLGRFWCGWLCPLGTLIDWISPQHDSERVIDDRWRRLPKVILALLLFAALWGNLTLLILDPLTIFVRSITTLLLPVVHWVLQGLLSALYGVAFLEGPLYALDTALHGTLLSYKQPAYQGLALLSAALAGILALNWIKRRFWCRYLCPLGGLLGLVARLGWRRRAVSDACIACGRCARDCRMGTIENADGYRSDPSECILCLDCSADCPAEAIHYRGQRAESRPSSGLTRRQALQALGLSLGGLALMRVSARAQRPAQYQLRPPGATESELLAQCVRCGACLRACPTHGLQPALYESGFEGFWTPILVPRLGNCEYNCTTCGQACPTGAIPILDLATKRLTPIGKASIDPDRCLAWSEQAPCIVCEEMCPLPEKAITLIEREAAWPDGTPYTLQLPVVQEDLCIGCGLCEHKCPVNGEAAIRVSIDPLG